ncbi:MAG: triose-phosphate isomerase [Candidatus Giovannonibacteria bacterium]|nr:triose-phosphate isomerase [Candidatus Giovannonibacteria bacterium]
MKKIIIANWKMNPKTPRDASRLADKIGRGVKNIKSVEVVFAPPFIHIPAIYKFKTGAQDCFYEKSGAYTGEVSPLQLKACGVRLVIVGHSERRALGETNEIVNKKLKAVLGTGMRAILCVGEAERQKEIAFPKIIRDELHEGLSRIKKSFFRNLIIAYEPIWAIGTGRADTPKNVYEITTIIRRELYRMVGKRIASKIPVLYGGSVDDKNSYAFVKDGAVDGLLVGGASLNANKFVKLVKAVAGL